VSSPSSPHPIWLAHVQGARRADAAAKEELETYFTPFVHGVLCCHLAHQVAAPMVRSTLDEAYSRLSELKESADFGHWILDLTRRIAKNVAKKPGAALEMVGAGAHIDGLKVLSKMRTQPEATRERLVLRLLEGIPGPEIADLSGDGQSEVRSDLERGFAQLIKDTSAQSVNLTGDTYLWSLAGTPHEKLVTLENQLTGLRYDPGSVEGLTMPVVAASPPPGKRPTSEHKRVTPPAPSAPAPAQDDDGTTPIGNKLSDDTTGATSQSLRRVPEEETKHVKDLPVAAQVNPFDAEPGTIPVSDLPAAAGVVPAAPSAARPSAKKRALEPEPSFPQPLDPLGTDALGLSVPGPTVVRTRTAAAEAKPEPDVTSPRGVPISILARSQDTSVSVTPKADPEQSWKVREYSEPSLTPVAPPPFSLTRGATPFYAAVVLTAVGLFIAWINVRGSERAAKRGWNLVPVMVATDNLSEGTVLTEDLVSTREVPEMFVTASVVKPDSVAYVVNQRILVPVQAGDPLLWTQFDSARATERMSRHISAHGRAFTIEAHTITSVGGWVRPGDHVDIVVSAKDPATKEKVAATTLQNIPILATGKITSTTNEATLKPNQKDYQNVSVLVLPEEAEILALMRKGASYRLVLRNQQDYEPFESGRSGPGTLLEGKRTLLLQEKRFKTIQAIRAAPDEKRNR
jgi:pilus assembly protein CpaB